MPATQTYPVKMTVSARDVAAELRVRLPGLTRVKLHKLLYYCQGHHLAAFDVPLFRESVSAWDMGPVVGEFWFSEHGAGSVPTAMADPTPLSESQLNTVGYVVSRYGGLTGADLINLTHGEQPWLIANGKRRPGERVRIEATWMRDFFRATGADDDDDGLLDSESVTAWLQEAGSRAQDPLHPDSRAELQSRLEHG